MKVSVAVAVDVSLALREDPCFRTSLRSTVRWLRTLP